MSGNAAAPVAEYRMSRGLRVFASTLTSLMILLFGMVLLAPLFPSFGMPATGNAYLIMAPFCLAMMLFMGYALLDALKNRLLIDGQQLRHISALADRTLALPDIKGYRAQQNYVVIEPIDPKQKKIRISRYTARLGELLAWLAARYPDLDQADARQSREEILADETYGATAADRQATLRQAGQVAGTLNMSGIVLGLLTFIHPQPYALVVLSDMLVAVACLMALRFSRGLIRAVERKGSGYPSVLMGLLMPALSLAFRSIIDFHLLGYRHAWQLSGCLAGATLVLTFAGNRGVSFRTGKAIFGLLFSAALVVLFFFGSLIIINCHFDHSAAASFYPQVLSKRETHDRSTTYYLELSAWGAQKSSSEVIVPRNIYQALQPPMPAEVQSRRGMLGMPWYSVGIP